MSTADRGPAAKSILLAAVTSSLAVIPVWLIGGLAVEIRDELLLTDAQLGLVTGSFMAASAMLSIPGGLIVRRWGWTRGIRVVAALTGLACLGIATLAQDWRWLVLFIGVAGASHAIGQPSANLALLEGVPRQRQGLAFGIKQSSIPAGTMFAGVSVPLVGVTLGWRWAFAIVTIACLLLAAGALGSRHRRDDRANIPRPRVGRRFPTEERLPLLLLALGGGLGTAASNTLGAFTVVHAAGLGLDSSAGGLLLAAGSTANIVARLLLGSIADRFDTDNEALVSAMMAIGSLGFLTIALAPTVPVLVIAVIVAFVTGWGWNGLYHLATMQRYRSSAASVTGLTGTFLSIGGSIGPIVFGLLAEGHSFRVAWFASAATSLAAGILIGLAGRMRRTPPGECLTSGSAE